MPPKTTTLASVQFWKHHKWQTNLPSTSKSVPVIKLPAGLHKSTTAPSNSFTAPVRPIGVLEYQIPFASSSAGPSLSTVSIYPGLMLFTRIPCTAHSAARQCAKCTTAALEMLYAACGWGKFTKCAEMEAIRTMAPGRCVAIICLCLLVSGLKLAICPNLPFGKGGKKTYLATACAQINVPVVLISSTWRHFAKLVSVLGTQFTIPA